MFEKYKACDKLCFQEFLDIIRPWKNPLLRSKVNAKATHKGLIITADIENDLIEIFTKEIIMEMDVGRMKRELKERKDCDVLEMFKLIDVKNKGYIDCVGLTNYLNSKGINIQDEDAIIFVHKLDKDLDSKLSYKEFMEGISCYTPLKESKGFSNANVNSVKKVSEILNEKKGYQTAHSTAKTESDASISSKNAFHVTARTPLNNSTQKTYLMFHSKSKVESKGSNNSIGVPELMQLELEGEKYLEELRQDIAICKDITIEAINHIFNFNTHIDPITLIRIYKAFGLNSSHEEIYLLFNRFDSDINGRLNVLNLLVPKDKDYANILLNRKSNTKHLSKSSYKLLQTLLLKYLEVEAENKKWKSKVSSKSIREAFDECDIQNKGHFNMSEV